MQVPSAVEPAALKDIDSRSRERAEDNKNIGIGRTYKSDKPAPPSLRRPVQLPPQYRLQSTPQFPYRPHQPTPQLYLTLPHSASPPTHIYFNSGNMTLSHNCSRLYQCQGALHEQCELLLVIDCNKFMVMVVVDDHLAGYSLIAPLGEGEWSWYLFIAVGHGTTLTFDHRL